MVDKKSSKKRGRPKRKKIELPTFESDKEFREYILNNMLELSVNLKTEALKTNNIKRPDIVRAKIQQYKIAIDSLKALNVILKDKEISELSEKLKLMQKGLLFDDNTTEDSEFIMTEGLKVEIDKFNKAIETVTREGLKFNGKGELVKI